MKNRREVLVFGSIYLWLSWISWQVKMYTTPAWSDGTLAHNHAALLAFEYTNNEQSRLLQFYVPEMFNEVLGLPIETAYSLQRILFVFLVFFCFHLYLREWFDSRVSMCGVVLLAAIIPLTFNFGDLQESAPLLLLTFLLALWAIRENRKVLAAGVFLLGGLNNETMLILPLVYLLYNFHAGRLVAVCRDTVLISLPMVVAVGTIRYITRDRPHLGGGWHLPENLEGIFSANAEYLGFVFIFGALWVFAFLGYKDKPLFLRRAALVMPFFIAAHLLTGIITEVRQMLPLSFIVIPMALLYVFEGGSRREVSKDNAAEPR